MTADYRSTNALDEPRNAAAAQARQEAHTAAARAGVSIRELTPQQMGDAAALLESIWHTPPVPTPLMVALSHAGASVAGAFAGGTLVGASVGYFAQPLGQRFHSHVTGVANSHVGQGIGRALKFHQRSWCLERGITQMTWTFDPLVSRNAAFNIALLGVGIADYLEDFYGQMSDSVNAGQGSDRLLANWNLERSLQGHRNGAAGPANLAGASAVLTAADSGRPQRHIPAPAATVLSVAVPADIEALRCTDPATATQWRGAVREELGSRIHQGWAVTGFYDHHYLLERS